MDIVQRSFASLARRAKTVQLAIWRKKKKVIILICIFSLPVNTLYESILESNRNKDAQARHRCYLLPDINFQNHSVCIRSFRKWFRRRMVNEETNNKSYCHPPPCCQNALHYQCTQFKPLPWTTFTKITSLYIYLQHISTFQEIPTFKGKKNPIQLRVVQNMLSLKEDSKHVTLQWKHQKLMETCFCTVVKQFFKNVQLYVAGLDGHI